MSTTLLVSVVCADRTGLVSEISAKLFDLGISLGDMTFNILGTGAEFTAICEPSTPVSAQELTEHLSTLGGLQGADIKVSDFTLPLVHGANAKVTHRIVLRGQDQPGLVTRLTEVLMEYEANIVTMKADKLVNLEGDEYLIQMTVSIPEQRAEACLASISNTASIMQMQCYAEVVSL